MEAVPAPAGKALKIAHPVVGADEVLVTAVQRQGHKLQVVGRRAPRMSWLTSEMKVSSTRGREVGLAFDDEALA